MKFWNVGVVGFDKKRISGLKKMGDEQLRGLWHGGDGLGEV